MTFCRVPLYVSASIITSCVAFLFGMDQGSIGPVTAMPAFRENFGHFSATLHGVIVSSALIPGAITALIAGAFAQRFGNVTLIALGSVTYGVGAAIECGAPILGVFILGRLIKGIGNGLFLSNVYVQVSEMSPSRIRGIMTALPQLLITLGLVTGYFVSYGSSRLGDSSVTWRLPLAIESFIGLILSVTYFVTPPSPRWLLSMGRVDEARVVAARLGLDEAEQKELFSQYGPSGEKGDADMTLGQILRQTFREFGVAFSAPYRGRTAFAVAILGLQQFSGIDGVLFYAPTLFTKAGLGSEQASFLASGVSALVIMGATIPGTLFADKWNRRTSGLVGGVAITSLMLIMGSLYAADKVYPASGAGRWVVIVCIYLFAISFSATWGISFRTSAVESTPRKTRNSAASLAQSSNWLSNYIVALVTPIILDKSTFGAYYWFAFTSLFTTILVYFFMIETRGHSLEEIEKQHDEGKARGGDSQWKSDGKEKTTPEVAVLGIV